MYPNQTTQNFSQQVAASSEKPMWKKALGITVIALVVITFWQWINSPMIVTVTGTGQVNVPATNATVTFAVISSDSTPQGAISGVKSKAENIKAFLKSSGISEEDIVTSQVTAAPAALTTVGGTGYQASITMSAKTVHVSTINDLISSLYQSGASAVSQPVLSVENQNSLDVQAFNSAMTDAGNKASGIAFKKWKLIKKVVAVTSQSSGTTSTATSIADTLTQSKSADAAQNGVFKIVETVSVTYKMW